MRHDPVARGDSRIRVRHDAADASIAGPPGSWPITVLPTISPSGWPAVTSARTPGRSSSFGGTGSSIGFGSNSLRTRRTTRWHGTLFPKPGCGPIIRRPITSPRQWPTANSTGTNWRAARRGRFLVSVSTAPNAMTTPSRNGSRANFKGLAALFGQAHSSLVGVEDKAKLVFEVEDRKTLKKHAVDPAVPFHPEWLPATGSLRERLAVWITHPQNRRFERATVNRDLGPFVRATLASSGRRPARSAC